MDLLLTIAVAFRALGRNKLRAGLTVLSLPSLSLLPTQDPQLRRPI